MHSPSGLILPPQPLDGKLWYECMFGDAIDVSRLPLVRTGLRNWLFNIPFSISEELIARTTKTSIDINFDSNTPYESLPQTFQLYLFDIAHDQIDKTALENRKIYSACGLDILRDKVHADYISNGIELHYIANRKRHFSIPPHIKYISNDCLNRSSDLSELTIGAKLSYGASEFHFTTPWKMLHYMPNLKKISFTGLPHSIEKVPAFGLGAGKNTFRVANLLNTDITFYTDAKNPYGFIQIDKSGCGAPFRYDLLGTGLDSKQKGELNKIKVIPFQDKDLVVYTNQIHISDIGHFYNVLKDLNNPNSLVFNTADSEKYQRIFRAIALQSDVFNSNYELIETFSFGCQKQYMRLLSPRSIFTALIDYLTLEARNPFMLTFKQNLDDLDALMQQQKEFKPEELSDKIIGQFLINCHAAR